MSFLENCFTNTQLCATAPFFISGKIRQKNHDDGQKYNVSVQAAQKTGEKFGRVRFEMLWEYQNQGKTKKKKRKHDGLKQKRERLPAALYDF